MALTGDETFGTVVPGFVTDAAGQLVVAAAGTRRDVVPGFLTDDDGRLVVAAEAGTWQDGFIRTADYALCVTETGTEMGTVIPGFRTDEDGLLIFALDPSPVRLGYFPGFQLDAAEALALTTG